MPLPPGTRLGRYEVRSQIGAGGMGEVYLAWDSELERQVALKVLPTDVAADQQRMSRFLQEAKAASALNHPNILSIYDVGQADSTRFIVMEYVEGETLRQHMSGGRVGLREALDVAAQLASALAEAHRAGIVHRDIKPENVMLRRGGIVKVLDFGIAKLAERQPTTADSEAQTRALVNTVPGTVMGTVAYMSPEQARGLEVEARTDIWSLGVLLYEMVAGRVPFVGETATDVLAVILHREPPSLLLQGLDVPDELERIVEKALAKDREERYQTAKDLALDLKRLRQRLETEAELERTETPERSVAMRAAATTGGGANTGTSQVAAAATGGAADIHTTTSSAEYLVHEIGRHKRGVAAALAAVILLSIAGVVYYSYFARRIDSIAVLPFVNAAGDPNIEYLSDGISESLINSLSQLPGLRVIARGTAFRYKGKDVDPQAVGRELNVRAMLTGRVRQVGDTLDIQVDLVDAATGAQLWGEGYERKVSDVLSVKQEITREVTEKLRLRLSGEEQRQLTRRDTSNGEAYQLYLMGRYYFNRKTADGFLKGLEYFEQAIHFDPNYALAYAGMSDCYYGLSFLYLSSEEAMPKAREAAQKALALDDTLAEAHTSLALVRWTYDWDWPGAEREFKRAVEINPGYAFAHQQYGMYLALMGRFDEAMTELKQAQRLDPLSPWINADLGLVLYVARRHDEAIRQFQETLEIDQNFAQAHFNLGFAYEQRGMYEEAIAEVRKGVSLSGDRTNVVGYLGYAYAVAGKRGEALKVIDELKEASSQRYIPPYHIARIYTGLGEKDQAFQWLGKAMEERYSSMVWLKVDPLWDPLRSDPRFADLMRRVGLPQ